MVTKQSEIKTWKYIYKIADMLLEDNPTTLIADVQLLQKPMQKRMYPKNFQITLRARH